MKIHAFFLSVAILGIAGCGNDPTHPPSTSEARPDFTGYGVQPEPTPVNDVAATTASTTTEQAQATPTAPAAQ